MLGCWDVWSEDGGMFGCEDVIWVWRLSKVGTEASRVCRL
jgi:hypothetical protein